MACLSLQSTEKELHPLRNIEHRPHFNLMTRSHVNVDLLDVCLQTSTYRQFRLLFGNLTSKLKHCKANEKGAVNDPGSIFTIRNKEIVRKMLGQRECCL